MTGPEGLTSPHQNPRNHPKAENKTYKIMEDGGQDVSMFPELKCPKCAKVVIRHFPPKGPEGKCPECGTLMVLNNRYKWRNK